MAKKLALKKMKPVIGVSGSAAGKITRNLETVAFIVGQEIARAGAILITGACTGLSHEAARGAKSQAGLVIGVSPAETIKQHQEKYQFPIEYFDLIIYTGFGYKGRNVIWVRSCDALICIAGRTGTLNEFTIAYDEGKPIGILQSGGVSQLIPKIVKIAKKGRAPIFYSRNPKQLVAKITKTI